MSSNYTSVSVILFISKIYCVVAVSVHINRGLIFEVLCYDLLFWLKSKIVVNTRYFFKRTAIRKKVEI